MNHPCVFAYLHLPVQSGSDAVLLKMNREYTVEGMQGNNLAGTRQMAEHALLSSPH